MTADLTRLTSIDRSTVPAAPVGAGSPVDPPMALTRIAPVDAQEHANAQPLGRSGLDLIDLFAVSDQVVMREPTGAVAREAGLEQARGSLLRNHAGEALSSLDAVWESARHSEEGWYLRSGALSALGLPGESERVAEEGLALRPSSMALRFMQSFARLTLGDCAGARTTLEPALERAPTELLLRVQRALVLAKQGDVKGANTQLQDLATVAPDHPAIAWGRDMIRATAAEEARQRARATPIAGTAALPERAPSIVTDPATLALERFGEHLATLSATETISEARMLMRAFSTGGALASVVTPEHAHAVRMILTTYLAVVGGAGMASAAPLRSLMVALVPLLQEGRASDAERIVQRQRPLLREPIGRLLLDIVRGAQPAQVASANPRTRETPSPGLPRVRGEPESGPLIPVRLGLGLLEETPASRAARDPTVMDWTTNRLPFAVREDGTVVRYMMSGVMQAIPDTGHGAELSGQGWGAARSAAAAVGSGSADPTRIPLDVVAIVALTVSALLTGHWFVAIGLAAAAVWLAVQRRRRSAGENPGLSEEIGTADAHERSSLR